MRLLLTVLFGIFALAAEAPVRAESGATCRIVFLNRPDTAPTSMWLLDGVSSQEVQLPGMNLSPVYKLRSDVTKLSLLPSTPEDKEPDLENAPSVAVPEGVTDF